MRKKLVRLLLLAIHACDGMPMPEAALISAVQNLARPEQPTKDDVMDALREAEADGFALRDVALEELEKRVKGHTLGVNANGWKNPYPKDDPRSLLLEYQFAWREDMSRFKIGLMSRQSGKDFSTESEAVEDCYKRPRTEWMIAAPSERQALDSLEQGKTWAAAFDLKVADYQEYRGGGSETLLKSAEIRFSNDSRIRAVPGRPDTTRGRSANIALTEFDFFEDPAAKASASEQVKAGQEVEKVEKEAFTSKQQLKQAVKGLKDEFPMLAHIGRLAVNPITAAVALAAGAWAIWKARVDATVQSLGGVAMPDVGDSWTKAPREAGKAWREYSEAIAKTIQKYGESEAASARTMARLKAELDLRLANIKAIKDYAEAKLEAEKANLPAGEYARRKAELGASASGAEAGTKWENEQDQWYAQNEKNVSLRQEAAAKEAAARRIHVEEPAAYAKTAADQKLMGEAAENELKKSVAWVNELADLKGSLKWFSHPVTSLKASLALGTGPTDKGIDELIGREQENQGGYRATMGRYERFQEDEKLREQDRARRKTLLDEAAGARGAAATGDMDVGEQAGALSGKHAGDVRNQALGALAEAYKALADVRTQTMELQKEIAKAVQGGNAVMAETLAKLQQLQAAQADMEKRIKASEGRPPRV